MITACYERATTKCSRVHLSHYKTCAEISPLHSSGSELTLYRSPTLYVSRRSNCVKTPIVDTSSMRYWHCCNAQAAGPRSVDKAEQPSCRRWVALDVPWRGHHTLRLARATAVVNLTWLTTSGDNIYEQHWLSLHLYISFSDELLFGMGLCSLKNTIKTTIWRRLFLGFASFIETHDKNSFETTRGGYTCTQLLMSNPRLW